ncbi:MAG TPA: hypothetical protein VOA87_19560 [Thermoanaerobaculia bacterium]|nr:hypothetical protein [Thermoanaerobaculia bacterium]
MAGSNGGEHPDPESLARYVRGELPRYDGRALELHLVACVACQRAVDAIPSSPAGVVRWRGHRFGAAGAFQRVDEARKEKLRGILKELGSMISILGEGMLRKLLREPEHGRRALIRNDPRYHVLHLCELLEERCREAWFDDPAEAVEMAKLAVAVADRLDPRHYGDKAVRDARALAWMHLGNAYRIASGGGAAGGDSAAAVAEAGVEAEGDAYEAAGVASSGLAEPGSRAEEAEAALAETRDAYLERGMAMDAALVTLDLATVYFKGGRSEELQRLAAAAVPLLAARGLPAEAVGRFQVLAESAAAGAVDLEALEAVAAYLQRARNDPRVRFEKNP